ncbi:hypothetical protein AB3S75_011733 [Citrus x aurantiifolia]
MTSFASSACSLNPNAQPFKPQPKRPFSETFIIPHVPVMTCHRRLSCKPKCFYQPKPPVWCSHSANVVPPYNNDNVKAKVAVTRPLTMRGKVVGHKRNLKWAPKSREDVYGAMLGENTTLMIRNIPNNLKRRDLLHILDNHCRVEYLKSNWHCKSEFDFLYLPMDFRRRANLGYAFVNFTTAAGALRLWKAFNKYKWEVEAPGNKKRCEIACADIQGRDALEKHFERFKFYCHTDGYLPVILSPPRDGWNYSKPIIVGKRFDVAAAPPLYFDRKFRSKSKSKPKLTRRKFKGLS